MHAIKPHDVIKSEQLTKTGLQGPNTHSCISKLANNTKEGLFSQNYKRKNKIWLADVDYHQTNHLVSF